MFSGMSGRQVLRATAVVLFGLLMLTMSLAGCRRPGVTEENYRRIQPGMTLEEVVSILGPNYQRQRSGVRIGDLEVAVERDTYVWRAPGRRVEVHFDDGVVERAAYHVETDQPRS
jgi:hypothetical protein